MKSIRNRKAWKNMSTEVKAKLLPWLVQYAKSRRSFLRLQRHRKKDNDFNCA